LFRVVRDSMREPPGGLAPAVIYSGAGFVCTERCPCPSNASVFAETWPYRALAEEESR